ncbi:MAG: tRNA (adenosine(37)-N6)-threonylcarbamoyltransferase complex ATPase subunit type 1 TsaE [Actinomycetota bacterium]
MSALPQPYPGRLNLETRSPEETRRLGAALSPILLPGDVLALSGDLGAGKTTFVQGLAAGLKVPERVTSPTFILMREYLGGRYPLMHIDIYRLQKIQEVIDLGYDEFLDPGHVVVIEWGDVVEPLLPREHLLVELTFDDGDLIRNVALLARGPQWRSRLETVRILTSGLFSPARDAEDLGLADPFEGRHN